MQQNLANPSPFSLQKFHLFHKNLELCMEIVGIIAFS